MTTSQHSLPSATEPDGASGVPVLVAALESAGVAIYCLAGSTDGVVWSNARARAMGGPHLSVVNGRPVTDLVETVLRTGRAETVSGPLHEGAGSGTAVAAPLPVAGGPGVLLLLEPDQGGGAGSWPTTWAADVVEQVQHALLPPSLPLLPDLDLSGSYHRASSVEAAGGDWYDVVPLGGGRLALVVGDAVGHGVPAAGAMSRLRGALRSTALRDPAPAVVVAALDGFAAQMEDVEGASVFYGLLDVPTGRISYAVAGHPAPLVVHADGNTSFLPVNPRPPLGSVPGTGVVVQEQVLDEGASLVLFSDGAVMGAAAGPVAGTTRLAEVARAVVSSPGALDRETAAGLAAAIAEGVHGPGGRPDDVAVLVAHRRAGGLQPLEVELPAVPSSLPLIRRRLTAWLAGLGMGEQDRVGVMVAAGEACANAAEHAYRGTEPGAMWVHAAVDVDGVLTVTVRDEGNWRPPDRDPGDRGRGLLIMRQLVDRVVLEEERGTTVTLSLQLRRRPEAELDPAAGEADARVVVDRSGKRPVVRVTGAVDEHGAEQLRIRLLEASHGGTNPVELDVTGVTLFSTSGVRVLLAVARIARDEGWRLSVSAPVGGVPRHVLEISGLAALVDLR